MSDIFISYSRKDSEQATELVEKLRATGRDVWIDRSAIDPSSRWSKEIVHAIDDCALVLLLLSHASFESENVIKELSLAGEKKKPILPIVIEDVPLTDDFEYHLAGLQKIEIENFAGIEKGIAHHVPAVSGDRLPVVSGGSMQSGDLRAMPINSDLIRLAVLPFDDLSPTKDNEWFADGMMDELRGTLSTLTRLKVPGRNDVIFYKKRRPKTKEIAKDLNVRYLVEGSVRKSGDRIRISVQLTDTSILEHVWSASYDGSFEDVFEFQERTAKAITEALQLTLSPAEKREIDKKPTEDVEAYELYLKGTEYFWRHTRLDYDKALALLEEAVRIDPNFGMAYSVIASTYHSYYRIFRRDPELLELSRQATERIKLIEGETSRYFMNRSRIALMRNNPEEALRFAQRSVEQDPLHFGGYIALGYAYQALGNLEEVVNARRDQVRLSPNDINSRFDLLIALHEVGDEAELKAASEEALPLFERHLRLNHDDFNARANYANVIRWTKGNAEALKIADELAINPAMDGLGLYNLACLYLHCGSQGRALKLLQRAVEKDYVDIETYRRDADLDPLRDLDEFKDLMKEIEMKIADARNPR